MGSGFASANSSRRSAARPRLNEMSAAADGPARDRRLGVAMSIKRSTPTMLAVALLLVLALARGSGAIALLGRSQAALGVTTAPAYALTWVAVGLLAVAIVALAAGIWLWLGRPGARVLVVLALALFVVGGVANGLVLFGAPSPQGVVLNVAYAALTVGFMMWGSRTERIASAA
jgi:hypothetical protein